MHPAMLQQLAAERIREMIAAADDARRAQQARHAHESRLKVGGCPGQRDLQRESVPVSAAIAANPSPSAPERATPEILVGTALRHRP
jgi:hypothetical protein